MPFFDKRMNLRLYPEHHRQTNHHTDRQGHYCRVKPLAYKRTIPAILQAGQSKGNQGFHHHCHAKRGKTLEQKPRIGLAKGFRQKGFHRRNEPHHYGNQDKGEHETFGPINEELAIEAFIDKSDGTTQQYGNNELERQKTQME